MNDNDTCYEATRTVVAAAENMAAADGYRARDINWTQVHWNYRARALMNVAYYRACAQRGDCPEMLPLWLQAEKRQRFLYENPSLAYKR